MLWFNKKKSDVVSKFKVGERVHLLEGYKNEKGEIWMLDKGLVTLTAMSQDGKTGNFSYKYITNSKIQHDFTPEYMFAPFVAGMVYPKLADKKTNKEFIKAYK